MLVLSRREGEEIVIDGKIRVRIASIRGSRVRLAIDAPREMVIERPELNEDRENKGSESQ